MKSFRIVIICGLICSWLFSLCACKSQMDSKHLMETRIQEYEVLVCGFSDSSSAVKLNKEYSFGATSMYTATNIEKEMKISIDGKEITGTYDYSILMEPNYFPIHYYNTAEKDRFGIDPDGLVTHYQCATRPTGQNDKLYTEEQCVLIARQFVNQFVNIEGYRANVSENIDKGLYDIVFTKMIGSVETTEFAQVRIYKNGSIYHYKSFMLGKITDDIPDSLQADSITEAIYKKLDTIYEPLKAKGSVISYEEPLLQYTVLESGEPAMYCAVNVEYKNQNLAHSDRLILLVGL